MDYDDRFRYLVGGYYGIKSMDDYRTKLYILKDREKLNDLFYKSKKK